MGMIDLVVCFSGPDHARKYCVMLMMYEGGGYVISDGFSSKKSAERERARLRRDWRANKLAGGFEALRTIMGAMGWKSV